MKRIGTNSEVAQAYAAHQERPSQNHGSNGTPWGRGYGGRASSKTFWHEDGILYSYSQPIARWFDNVCLVNADRFTPTTNQHQGELRNALHKAEAKQASVSFEAMRQHSVLVQDRYAQIDLTVLDTRPDVNEFVYAYHASSPEDKEAFETFEQRIRAKYGNLGTLSVTEDSKDFHLTGGSLLKASNKVIWSSIDHQDYFSCQLSDTSVRTIEEAIESLKPLPIRERTDLIRQGEFFFVPTNCIPPKRLIEKWVRLSDMVRQGWPVNLGTNSWGRHIGNEDSGHHTAEFFAASQDGNPPLVSGRIKDLQHGTLNLGSAWFEVWHNTQIVSYSASLMGLRID